MKLKNVFVILGCLFAFIGSIRAQTNIVHVLPFLLDGKEVGCEYKITLYVDGKKLTPSVEENSFKVPTEISKAKKIALRLTCGTYKLSFNSLRPSDFVYNDSKYEWVVGIDRQPFEEVYVYSTIEDKVKEVHYIKFQPDGYVSTYLPVYIYKSSKKFFSVKKTKSKP